jgi:5-methyltetrahydropteroyltriglutamate--homocysteine methyltransferase
MFTATADQILPTTVTGSWPRPSWYQENLAGRQFTSWFSDMRNREHFLDAISTVVHDQMHAGLDILTNGDYHLDNDLAGRSWILYPIERFSGFGRLDSAPTPESWAYAPGSLLNEIVTGWYFPPVVDKIEPQRSLELGKIWRIAQAQASRPVKLGIVCAQAASLVLTNEAPIYADKQLDLIMDLSKAINHELRELAAAGCKVIQVEDPIPHLVSHSKPDKGYLDFLVDAFNCEIDGLDDAEVWIHTCWGNPAAQRMLDVTSYAETMETYLYRLKGDVWTVEMRERDQADLELFGQYKEDMPKKVAIGVVSHRNLQVETPEEVAGQVRNALRFIRPENLILSSDCGFGRQGCTRAIAFYKASAIAQGANIVRRELGAEETYVGAADPDRQLDVRTRAS